uniref:Mucin-5AC-like n=1 Tax=Panagrellus redivivus TaxID=6233 RepID=A0A7E4V351_PANRE
MFRYMQTGVSYSYFCDTSLCNTINDADFKLFKKHTTFTTEYVCLATEKAGEQFTECESAENMFCGYKKNIATGKVWMGCRLVPPEKRGNMEKCFKTDKYIEYACGSSVCSNSQSCKTWETGVEWPFGHPPTTTTKKPTTTTKKPTTTTKKPTTTTKKPTTTLASTTATTKTTASTKAGSPATPSRLSDTPPAPPSLDNESKDSDSIETSSLGNTGSGFTMPTVATLVLFAGVYFTL